MGEEFVHSLPSPTGQRFSHRASTTTTPLGSWLCLNISIKPQRQEVRDVQCGYDTWSCQGVPREFSQFAHRVGCNSDIWSRLGETETGETEMT